MSFIIQAVATYAPWIYAACALVALYQLYQVVLVRSERRQALFSLEREKAIRDMYQIFYVAFILLTVMGATYFTSTTLASAVEPLIIEALAPTPEVPNLPTPTNTPLPATTVPTITPTRPATAVPEVVEELPTTAPVQSAVVQAPLCPDGRSVLQQPGSNQEVSGTISIIGTATHDQFQYYKIEYAAGANATQGFAYLAGDNSAVIGSRLATVDTRVLSNGQWTLQLIVVDQTGNFPPPCRVTISVRN